MMTQYDAILETVMMTHYDARGSEINNDESYQKLFPPNLNRKNKKNTKHVQN